MSEEEMIECPQCSHPISMSALENKSEYTCPNCETVLELESDDETETQEVEAETEVETENTEETSDSENESEEEGTETSDEETEAEVGESEPETEPVETKPKKSRTPRAKNPEEVKKYMDFIIRQPNGVQAPMVSEHFGVSERFSRLMIRNACKMAEENGMKVEAKSGGKGKRKTYLIHG